MDRTFVVTVDLPSRVSDKEIKEYIHDAVRGWGGGRHPDDPFFGMSSESVRVSRAGTIRKKEATNAP